MKNNKYKKKIIICFLYLLFLFSLALILCSCEKIQYEKYPLYTVKYIINKDGKNEIYEDHGHRKGSTLNLPQVIKCISYEGFVLEGWYNIENNTKWDFGEDGDKMPGKTLVLKSRWRPEGKLTKSHSVTFVYQIDGVTNSYTSSQTYMPGELIDLPNFLETLNNNGRAFLGWYDKELRDKITSAWNFNNNTMPDHDLILEAQWESAIYSVKYDFADGKTEVLEDKDNLYFEGSTLKVLEKTSNPLREGYKFLGWFNNSKNTPWIFGVDGDKMPNHNLLLKAHWEPKFYTVTYIFDNEQGVIRDQNTYTFKSSIVELEETKKPVKTGYEFQGWIDQNIGDAKTSAWNFTTDTMPNHDLLLKANWVKKILTVRYCDEETGETLFQDTKQYYFGDLVDKHSDYYKEGYKFIGWFVKEGGIDKKWDFDKDLMPQNNLTLYAKMIKKHSVYYYNNGSNIYTDYKKYIKGDLVSKYPNLYEEDKIFEYWMTKDEQKWDFDKDTIQDEDLILKAKWSKLYTVSYLFQNSILFQDPIKYKRGDLINKQNDYYDEEYKFLGWIDEDKRDFDINSQPFINWDFDKNKMPDHNLYLKANVIKLRKVIYQSNGSTIFIDKKYYQKGERINKYDDLVNFKQENYKFNNWLYNNKPWDFDNNVVEDKDIILIADWKESYWTVTIKDADTGIQWPLFENYGGGDSIDFNKYLIKTSINSKSYYTSNYIKKEGCVIEGFYLENPNYLYYKKNQPGFDDKDPFEGDYNIDKNSENTLIYPMDTEELYSEPINPNAKVFNINYDKMPNHNLLLYVKWKRKYCKVTFIINSKVEYIAYDHVCGRVPKPWPISNGWFYDSNFNNIFDFRTKVYTDLILYGKTIDINSAHFVTFVSKDYSYMSPSGETFDDDLYPKYVCPKGTCSPDPFLGKQGYIYRWYTDSNYTNKFDFDTDELNVDKLYAKEEPLKIFKNYFYYLDLSDWEVAICGIASTSVENLIIPRRINNKFVTQIGLGCSFIAEDIFKGVEFSDSELPDMGSTVYSLFPSSPFNSEKIKSVKLHHAPITHITKNAFANCMGLKNVVFPLIHYEVGDSAFNQMYCYSKHFNIERLKVNGNYKEAKYPILVDLRLYNAKIIGIKSFLYAWTYYGKWGTHTFIARPQPSSSPYSGQNLPDNCFIFDKAFYGCSLFCFSGINNNKGVIKPAFVGAFALPNCTGYIWDKPSPDEVDGVLAGGFLFHSISVPDTRDKYGSGHNTNWGILTCDSGDIHFDPYRNHGVFGSLEQYWGYDMKNDSPITTDYDVHHH